MTDHTISDLVFKQLQTIPENTHCFDCGNYLIPPYLLGAQGP